MGKIIEVDFGEKSPLQALSEETGIEMGRLGSIYQFYHSHFSKCGDYGSLNDACLEFVRREIRRENGQIS
ncbi:MAG: hypothetical protein CMH64_04355 [Nanoarchaeota archaeon]|nr:hypothetical protein [Nanoarchaeota archaeon]|tara:strand:+ start:712 stop:921 length:210 start_codon:yes stop_codon:yes gene_type:complete